MICVSKSRRRRGFDPQLVAVWNCDEGAYVISPKGWMASIRRGKPEKVIDDIRLRRLHTHFVRLHTNPSDWIKTKGSGDAASFCFWPARTDSNLKRRDR